jgi:hypothetical protein
MGILNEREAAKSYTNINEKNAGTTGTRTPKPTLSIQKQKENCGSVLFKFTGTKPALQMAPTDSGIKNPTDAVDIFMPACAILKRYDVTYPHLLIYRLHRLNIFSYLNNHSIGFQYFCLISE